MTVGPLRHLAPDMAERVSAELAAIERDHGVEILLAVESGSRAWGFPSLDSDYDVRFIYLRPVAEYLTVVPCRDVIERPVDAVLDVSGWDLRKALQLMLKSNAVLQEWLSSPVRYIGREPVSRQLSDMFDHIAETRIFAYHYDHQARRSFSEIFDTTEDSGNAVRMKSYCYALRASLALCWLRDRGTAPPMDLPSLIAGLALPAALVNDIASLVTRKLCAQERDTTGRIETIDAFIEHVLAQPAGAASPTVRRGATARVDAFFASLVLER